MPSGQRLLHNICRPLFYSKNAAGFSGGIFVYWESTNMEGLQQHRRIKQEGLLRCCLEKGDTYQLPMAAIRCGTNMEIG